MSRLVYIDLGCGNGDTVEQFMKNHANYEAYGFDPYPFFNDKLNALTYKYNFLYEKKAAWTNNNDKVFRMGGKSGAASSIIPFKRIKRIQSTKTVICFDFSAWIIKNFEKNDYIYLRMDIEASEYYVLDKMIKNGSIYYIDVLNVEFHKGRKIIGEDNKNKIEKMHSEILSILENIESLIPNRKIHTK